MEDIGPKSSSITQTWHLEAGLVHGSKPTRSLDISLTFVTHFSWVRKELIKIWGLTSFLLFFFPSFFFYFFDGVFRSEQPLNEKRKGRMRGDGRS